MNEDHDEDEEEEDEEILRNLVENDKDMNKIKNNLHLIPASMNRQKKPRSNSSIIESPQISIKKEEKEDDDDNNDTR